MILATEDYVSIVLGIVLLLLIIALIVMFLVKKGYLGHKVSPTNEEVDDKPKLISYFSRSGNSLYSESIGPTDHSTPRSEYKPGPEVNPIIYLRDDIYYPPKTQAPPVLNTDSWSINMPEKCKIHKKSKPRRIREPARNESHLPQKESKVTETDDNDDDDIVVIADNGIDIYTRYRFQDPYEDWNP